MPGLGIGTDYITKAALGANRNRLQYLIVEAGNTEEWKLTIKKGCYGNFIRRIEDGRCGTTSLQDIVGQLQATEAFEIRWIKIKMRDLEQIERFAPAAIRSGQAMA